MVSKVLRRLIQVAAMFAGASLVLAGSLDAERPGRGRRPTAARGFNLFAGSVNVIMNVNRVQCNINNIGESCVDPTNSPSLAGGFWPRGTGNQYIFNAGLQIAGRIGGTATATFDWPGDIVGAFFFDPKGTEQHGEGRTNVFNSLNGGDVAEWPAAANIRDTALFHPALVSTTFGGQATSERLAISQQDTWVRFWDGNTNLTAGRLHPMGLLVEQRGLAWNFPSGNQDIVYFLYRFINISTTNTADYAALLNAGYTTTDIAEIVAIAQEFQQRNEAAFNVDIPAGGYPITDLFAAFAQDPDVTAQAGNNFSSANLVFSIGSVYSGAWQAEASFVYPPDINSAPFAAAPGFEGVKYLKSPTNPATGTEVGLTMFGNTTNGGAFPDSRGIEQHWRRMSGNLTAADGSCSVPNPQVRRFCFVNQAVSDTRFFQASGPFTLNPGEAATIVVAYIHAAPLGTAPAATPPFGPAIPAFTLPIGTVTPPGLPMEGQRLFTGADLVKTYDRAMGWLNHSDIDGDGIVEQCTRDRGTVPAAIPGAIPSRPCITEVVTQPRSLLNKANVAQAVFDNKFLLPFAPEAPRFFLVPGDNRVTVVWQASETETIGDPYFQIASNPLSPLFDPNFRRFDVEGYRIWRGRTQADMQVIASFDYAGTTITDFTGQFFVAANYGNQCAPELGILFTCPVPFNPAGTGPSFPVPLSGDVVQVPPGGRVETAPPLANGRGVVLITTADTAVTGGGSGLPGLTDTGVPFSFVDTTARNGFRYFYAVTAFDVNSVRSGPSSLESALITQTTTPRVGSGQDVAGQIGAVELRGRGTALLNPNAALPTLDPATGIFSGPMPATDGLGLDFASFLPELLADGSFEITMDSVVPGSGIQNHTAGAYWFHAVVSGQTVNFSVPVDQDAFDVAHTSTGTFEATSISTAQSQKFGGDSTFSLFGVATVTVPGAWRVTQWGRGEANAAPANSSFNGPRWWSGAANENTNDPNGIRCSPAVGTCVQANLTRNAGTLPGVTTLFHVSGYSTITSVPAREFESITSYVVRAADFAVYWGAAGAIDSVIDVTHNVTVPHVTRIGAGWGFLTPASFAGVPAASTRDGNNALLTWSDMTCVAPAPTFLTGLTSGGFAANCGGVVPGAVLQNTATLSPVAATASSWAGASALAATGNGFIFFLNGHFFVMQMAALPAAGTVWNARFYSGTITGTAGSYAFTSEPRAPAVPGLRAALQFTGSTFDATSTNVAALANVHTVPDPYYVTNSLEITANTKILRFVNLPSQAIIRIYSSSGILVNIVNHNDAQGGSEATWNLRNRNNQFVASGVYFYHVETPDGLEKVGRFTVVNFAQ